MSFLFLSLFFVLTLSSEPPQYGPYGKNGCEKTTVHIGGFKAGWSEDAEVMWPKEALSKKTKLPFLAFAHGMTAGGTETYWGYEELWRVVCSYGYVIAGPMSCRDFYCQKFYQDVITTINTCKEKGASLTPALGIADFSSIGLYGHSMGGAATVHVATYANELNASAAVGLHPAVVDDKNHTESKDIQVPMLYFTGSKDDIVPASGVKKSYEDDPDLPKIYAEIKGVTHFYPTGDSPNVEAPYTALFFDCWLKGNATACNNYFYETTSKDFICTGGIEMTSCLHEGKKDDNDEIK